MKLLLYAGASDVTEIYSGYNDISTPIPHGDNTGIGIWILLLIGGLWISLATSNDDSSKGVNRFLNFSCIYIAAFFIWWIYQILSGNYI